MSIHKDVRTFTCTVDVYGYVASDLVSEVLHQRIQHVAVLLDRIVSFGDDVLSESLPCDSGRSLRQCEVQQLAITHRNSSSPSNF
jgi:hypothetical protein